MELFSRIKKYLFLLAFVISLTFGIHIVIVYLYDEAEMVAERGGTFSVGIIGTSSSLNPTQYLLDTGNDFILRFLYRGLLKYNPETKVMEGDLANCDISKNLGEIRCFFKGGAAWSDGTKISIEDVLATYSLLAETDVNKKLESALSKFAITREENTLVFRSTNSSIETLQLLTIPIIKKSVTERMRNEGKFQEEAYSGYYKMDKREMDGVRMSENITLIANDTDIKNQQYARIVLKVFGDKETLIAQKDSLNLVFPGYYEGVDFGDRFAQGEILTPDFVGAFLNSEKLTPERRKVISGIIDQILVNASHTLQPIKNPFFSDSKIVSPIGSNLDEALLQVGYLRKKDLPKIESGSSQTGTGVSTPVVSVENKPEAPVLVKSPKIVKNTLNFIDTPSKEALISLGYKDEIQIEGQVPKGVTAVYINNYQLKGYTEGQTRFLYRARVEIGNLKKGANTYTLAFEKNGKKITEESIVIHNGDGFIVPKEETPKISPEAEVTSTGAIQISSGTLIQESKANPITSTSSTLVVQNTQSEMRVLSGGTSRETSSQSGNLVGTGTLVGTGASSSNTSTIAKTNTGEKIIPPIKTEITPIQDKKLYYKNGNTVKLIVQSLSPKTEISDISKEIVAGLEKVGFTVQFEEVESSSSALGTVKNYDSKNYDIFITGVNLGYIGTYIMPYFHSGQVQNGFNFSLIRNPALDILLEELKTKDLTMEARTRQFEKVNDILKKESVLVPIGTNPLISFVDKNIQDFNMPKFLPSAVFLDNAILQSYINKTYIVQIEKKSAPGFFSWCKTQLFSVP